MGLGFIGFGGSGRMTAVDGQAIGHDILHVTRVGFVETLCDIFFQRVQAPTWLLGCKQ